MSGLKCLSCATRRVLEEPTRAPRASPSNELAVVQTNASRASARSPTVVTENPSGNLTGTSFML